ncbi:N-acetylglucosamine-binding protein GbpA [Trinickia mobilis]|uniref:N-acetylglucosamine-binding protein GbpA n=1 Tax=Trinickia mobilis TaxID=2816356 RepID=UPI001A8CD736|nr:N-acetylglucosamine-binding protein GbpA [Trinickia mobilis]
MQKPRWFSNTLLKLSPLVACASMMFAQNAFAHGYLVDGRAKLCQSGANSNCGPVQWEPQSVEGPDGFPGTAGPKDGTIAAAGNSTWGALNEQLADRWTKTTIKTGKNTFKWHHTANHVTKDYRYYITKQGWNPNKPLSRDAFDTTPFCTLDYGMKQPTTNLSMDCTVPSDRSGYHVILSVWDVGDTAASFYNVMDANIVAGDGGGNGGTPNPPPVPQWKDVGDIYPSVDLKAGDKVKTRVFKSNGEVPSLSTSITIQSDTDGAQNAWSKALATAINKAQPASLMAGVLGANGSIRPAAGKNEIFAKEGSGINRVEIAIEKKPSGDNGGAQGFTVTAKSSYPIENGKARIDPFVTVNKASAVDVHVFDKKNERVGFANAMIERSGTVSVDVPRASPGEHTLVVRASVQGGATEQQSFDIKLTGGTDNGAQCQSAYQSGTAYTGGAKVQHQGKTYSARWWTQNQEPGNPAFTGADGSGKVWKDEGACK